MYCAKISMFTVCQKACYVGLYVRASVKSHSLKHYVDLQGLIQRYLFPLEKNKAQEERVANELKVGVFKHFLKCSLCLLSSKTGQDIG